MLRLLLAIVGEVCRDREIFVVGLGVGFLQPHLFHVLLKVLVHPLGLLDGIIVVRRAHNFVHNALHVVFFVEFCARVKSRALLVDGARGLALWIFQHILLVLREYGYFAEIVLDVLQHELLLNLWFPEPLLVTAVAIRLTLLLRSLTPLCDLIDNSVDILELILLHHLWLIGMGALFG